MPIVMYSRRFEPWDIPASADRLIKPQLFSSWFVVASSALTCVWDIFRCKSSAHLLALVLVALFSVCANVLWIAVFSEPAVTFAISYLVANIESWNKACTLGRYYSCTVYISSALYLYMRTVIYTSRHVLAVALASLPQLLLYQLVRVCMHVHVAARVCACARKTLTKSEIFESRFCGQIASRMVASHWK